jgi:hypothetical protein
MCGQEKLKGLQTLRSVFSGDLATCDLYINIPWVETYRGYQASEQRRTLADQDKAPLKGLCKLKFSKRLCRGDRNQTSTITKFDVTT